MFRMLAVSRRILSQFRHDKRTMLLLFVAPLLVLWLLSVLLSSNSLVPSIATVDLPESYHEVLEDQDVYIIDVSFEEAEVLLSENETDAVLFMVDDTTLQVWVEGSDSTKTASVAAVVSAALSEVQGDSIVSLEASLVYLEEIFSSNGFPDDFEFSLDLSEYIAVQEVEVSYLHGSEAWEMFDYYGPVFIGIFVFVFVFITSGMSLVNERSAGTMSRFLATPIKPLEILGGYVVGFGVLALVQSVVILSVSIGLIGFPHEGSVVLMALITVSMALASTTLGLLVSGMAKNAFQVIQLMLLFVVPQILLSGLFDLSATPMWMQVLSKCFPVTYGVEALRDVMLRGADFTMIFSNVVAVWGFIGLFFILAAQSFKKKRYR